MAIDGDLSVQIDNGTVYFEAPGINSWAEEIGNDNKDLDARAAQLAKKIIAVEGLVYKNGTPVTLEDLKACKFPINFFFVLNKKYLEAVVGTYAGAANSAKNG